MICIDTYIKRGFAYSCHLFSDDGDLQRLHSFAREIGLQRTWFQDSKVAHYDITSQHFRKAAIVAGAAQVGLRDYAKAGRRTPNE